MAEFSLAILLFIVIMMGLIEFGRMLQAWVTLQLSAQAGARYAITGQQSVDPAVDPWDVARLNAIKAEVRKKSSSLSIKDVGPAHPGHFNVSVFASDPPEPGHEFPGGPNARVIIDVVHNHELFTPFLKGLIPYVRLSAHAEKINERFRHPGYGKPVGELPPTIVTPTPTLTYTATELGGGGGDTPTPSQTPTRTSTPTQTSTLESGTTPTVCTTPIELGGCE